MQRYFAFLRAINVGGRRLSNSELTQPFDALGLAEVAAYQAAGNTTFRCASFDDTQHAALQATVNDAYGFDSPVFVRSRGELVAIAGAQPFDAELVASTEGRIQVAFMHAVPDPAAVAGALALVPERDRVVFSDREWFWLPSRGISDSTLPVKAIEELVGPMTIRTLGTITRMVAKFT